MDASQPVPENTQDLPSARAASAKEAAQRRLPNPLGRWETPLLFVVGISTILLWLLQDIGYRAPWFTHIGPWVALGVGILSFSLLIVYVLGMLVRKRQERLAAPITAPDQADAAGEAFPEDKTFQQALQELYQRLTKERTEEIYKRLDQIMGHTIESLTADIEQPVLREQTTEALRKVKLVYLLRLWRQKGRLNQVECDELEQLIIKARLVPPLDGEQ
jgi:hypothetical protein